MREKIEILNTPRSGPGQSPTLVGYSSLLNKFTEAKQIKSESQSPSQQSSKT